MQTPGTLPDSPEHVRSPPSRHLIGGKYELKERLGEGALGVVYRALHVGLERQFAIKLLKTFGSPTPAALERFRREAVALGRLRHPNIVDVTDSGIDALEGSLPYIVMELLDGVPLSDICSNQGPLPLAQALPLLEQIADAVDAAHSAGVLHRDLKPGNVFVCAMDPPRIKVLDFGLAELLAGPDNSSSVTLPGGRESPPALTATGALLGTPLYVAPELIRLSKASRASDIYSFGVLAYEILGGKPPFQGTLEEVLAGHSKAVPPPLPLPPGVWRPLRATLQKDPTLRPDSAGEVVRRFRKGMVEAELASGNQGLEREVGTAKPIAVARAGQETRESRKRLLAIAAVLVWVALVLVGVLGFRIERGPVPLAGINAVAENNDDATRQPVGVQELPVPLVPESRPAEPPSSTSPISPGATLRFNDIERACGNLSSLPNYLCLINRGSEAIAGGARLVITEELASFTSHATYNNGITISVEGKERYRLEFGPPKGKALIPGLYTGATRWPSNNGPYPGMYVAVGSSGCDMEDERFRILKIHLTGDNIVRRFVADFETTCAIGRIAVGQEVAIGEQREQPSVPFKSLPAELSSSTAPTSPGVTLGFSDLERACGNLAVPNYLCLVNRGSDQIAGGARQVITEDLASFTSRTSHSNSISIGVEGKERYRLEFGPPKGKPLVPGLYPKATRWPFNEGPYAGIDFAFGSSGCNSEEGQFRILEILLTGDKLRRFVADFETTCHGAIGRIAVGQRIEITLHR